MNMEYSTCQWKKHNRNGNRIAGKKEAKIKQEICQKKKMLNESSHVFL